MKLSKYHNKFFKLIYTKLQRLSVQFIFSTKLEINRERVICSIRIDSNGTIIMKPDFSSSPYLVNTFGSSKETFQYFIEHVSNPVKADNLLREQRLHSELYSRHTDYLKSLIGNAFEMPSMGVLRVHVFGEILSARNFDYDDLNVYYQLELPRSK